MRAPAVKFEINVTTVVAVIGLVLAALKIAYVDAGFRTTTEQHVLKTEERLGSIEGQLRQVDNLSYRITLQEQGVASLTASVTEMRKTMSDMTGDIRLIREIVTRIEGRPGTSN